MDLRGDQQCHHQQQQQQPQQQQQQAQQQPPELDWVRLAEALRISLAACGAVKVSQQSSAASATAELPCPAQHSQLPPPPPPQQFADQHYPAACPQLASASVVWPTALANSLHSVASNGAGSTCTCHSGAGGCYQQHQPQAHLPPQNLAYTCTCSAAPPPQTPQQPPPPPPDQRLLAVAASWDNLCSTLRPLLHQCTCHQSQPNIFSAAAAPCQSAVDDSLFQSLPPLMLSSLHHSRCGGDSAAATTAAALVTPTPSIREPASTAAGAAVAATTTLTPPSARLPRRRRTGGCPEPLWTGCRPATRTVASSSGGPAAAPRPGIPA
ncbi:hypothetical protein BOX15_Mlig023611g1 [Macrostomum lignano]|uniref:Uncharacterized protein n=1 Tax=Macrostomum lignano TaxID=282301 RepID=A0A267FPG2_9PLAT|nr:hypothetical protein BOX15_Mlig023611g1 [Macrostomum lignano]